MIELDETTKLRMVSHWIIYRWSNELGDLKIDDANKKMTFKYIPDLEKLQEQYIKDLPHYNIYMIFMLMFVAVGDPLDGAKALNNFPSVNKVNKKPMAEFLKRTGFERIDESFKVALMPVMERAGIIKRMRGEDVIFDKLRYTHLHDSLKKFAAWEMRREGFVVRIKEGDNIVVNDLGGMEKVYPYILEELEEIYNNIKDDLPPLVNVLDTFRDTHIGQIPFDSLPFDLGTYHWYFIEKRGEEN